ncbi:MAG: transposase, partial [Treponema sp.]|nr:transposase [Treponema sp.]
MARKPRKESSSQKYHIILRGNNKQLLFYDEKDCEFFLKRVFKYADQLEVKIYSYCLMGNHVHILLGNAPKETLSLFVQNLSNSYVYYFNHKYDCSGHLFQGRFKSEPI